MNIHPFFRPPVPRTLLAGLLGLLAASHSLPGQTNAPAAGGEVPGWLTQPLSLDNALDLALQQNPAILKSRKDLEATHGVVVQTRAIALPRLRALGDFNFNEGTESFALPGGTFNFQQDKNWTAGIRLEQSIYEGGRMRSSLRTARHLQEQAVQQHRSVINNAVLEVRTAYLDTLLAAQQIVVNEKSVALLQKELDDTRRRYEAGTVPKFDVLRAEVQVANAKPKLSRSRNAWRISKNNLTSLLGYDLPTNIWENIPLQLTGRLEREPFEVDLPEALAQALQNRPELAVIRQSRELAREDVVNAKSGYKPSIQVFGGYQGRNTSFEDDLGVVVDGWVAGAQANWYLFDGLGTQGRITEAKAKLERADVEEADSMRQIELEVRTAYSGFIEAREVLDSTEKVVEQAEEALRLATSRYDAGTGTQLDVLAAETSLTEARTTKNVALRDYAVALARLERAIGLDYATPNTKP
ncbi:MAG: TolC family protein [Verrucomicrobia bacterium]|jgi:outer membrane protein TolC|nr:TolC family protein [Verrucomicrobiota bacterium]